MRLSTIAPAKVNLVLRVGPLRADGYHDLLTLMAPLDLGDRVEVRVSPRPGDDHLPGSRPAGAVRPGEPGRPGRRRLPRTVRHQERARDPHREAHPGDGGPGRRLLGRGRSHPLPGACLPGPRPPGARRDRALGRLRRPVLPLAGAGLGGGARASGSSPPTSRSLDLVLAFPEDPALAIRAGEAYAWLDEARQRGAPARPSAVRVGSPRPARGTTSRRPAWSAARPSRRCWGCSGRPVRGSR